jgi:hypothetical protein
MKHWKRIIRKEVELYARLLRLWQTLQSDYLHLWYALSKDFAMSGFRFGIVHSLNEAFLKGVENANIPHMVSNLNPCVSTSLPPYYYLLNQALARI